MFKPVCPICVNLRDLRAILDLVAPGRTALLPCRIAKSEESCDAHKIFCHEGTQRTQRQELMMLSFCDLCVLLRQFIFDCAWPRCAFRAFSRQLIASASP
jgi:hypothetical protein